MDLVWPIIYPSLVGVACLAYLGWCVVRARPDDGGGPAGPKRHDPRRWHRDPRSSPPRRGPHAPGADLRKRRFAQRP